MTKIFKLKSKEIVYGFDTLNVRATCDEEAKQVAIDTLNLIADRYMPISDVRVLSIEPVTAKDFDVKVVYCCNFKVKKEKDKQLRYWKDPKIK